MKHSVNAHEGGSGGAAKGAGLEIPGSVHATSELQERGIDRVRVLRASDLDELALVAVSRALKEAIADLDLPEAARARLAERAQEAQRRLLAGAGASGAPSAGRFLAEEERAIEGLLREEAAGDCAPVGLSPYSDEFRAFEERMVEHLSTLLERDWRQDLQKVEASQRKQLALLEQRISKLVRALESTDRVLAHVQQGRRLAARHRDLAAGEPDPTSALSEKKSQLLQALFQANLELKKLETGSESPVE